MQYVLKRDGKLLDSNGRPVEHFNQAELFPTRDMARSYKSSRKATQIYRVKVKPVTFEKVS